MGKIYANELKSLDSTYKWALSVPLGGIREFVERSIDLPLIAVGSGGSYSVAHFASLLHSGLGCMSKAVTPLGCQGMRLELRNCSALIISARGKNPDIVATLKHVACSEPRHLHAICLQRGSELSRVARDYRYVQFDEFNPPFGRDGFLATNSLLASSILLYRGYSEIVHYGSEVPSGIELDHAQFERLEKSLRQIVGKKYLTILHGGWASVAAFDLESKLTEGGICAVQLADFRNFGHGRHYWLARHGSETGLVCIASRDEMPMARKILDVVPTEVPSILMSTDSVGPTSAMELLVKSFYVVQSYATHLGVDPGRPNVPEFGRRIYSMGISVFPGTRTPTTAEDRSIAILRKVNLDRISCLTEKDQELWIRAYESYLRGIAGATFGSVVFDYDGTLCDPCERYGSLAPEIAEWLKRLVTAGITVGIASGRGKSIGVALRNAIPKIHHNRVLVGYYNGGDIAPLGDVSHPDVSSSIDSELACAIELLRKSADISETLLIETRPMQATIGPRDVVLWKHAKSRLYEAIAREGLAVKILESDHSVDIVPQRITKLDLVDACKKMAEDNGQSACTLCVGDRGKWPGNDFELLSTPYSLSVDAVSSDPASCWNMSAAGHRGVQATLNYLDRFEVAAKCLSSFRHYSTDRRRRTGGRQ